MLTIEEKRCSKCQRVVLKYKRKMCNTCYEYARRHKVFEVIKPPTFKVNKEQNDVILGSLLGDGHLEINSKAKTARFSILHKTEDIGYLEYKYKILENMCCSGVKSKSYFDKRTNKIYYSSWFKTRYSKLLYNLYASWYPNKGKKIVPNTLEISPILLLIWFLDDGHFCRQSANSLVGTFSTNCFTRNEVIFLIKKLSDFTGEKFRLSRYKDQFTICFSTKTVNYFLKLILPILPECMNRKLKKINRII